MHQIWDSMCSCIAHSNLEVVGMEVILSMVLVVFHQPIKNLVTYWVATLIEQDRAARKDEATYIQLCRQHGIRP